MKFGKALESWVDQNSLHPKPNLQYRILKKILKRTVGRPDNLRDTGSPASASCDEQPEDAINNLHDNAGMNLIQQQQLQQHEFVACLHDNLRELNEFFMDQEEDAIMRLQMLRDGLTIATARPGAEQAFLTQPHRVAAPGSPPAHQDTFGRSSYLVSVSAKEALVQMHGHLVQVKSWALMNNAAVLKIVKKHDKLTGQRLMLSLSDWLYHQPMSSLDVVGDLVREVEALVATATATSPSRRHNHTVGRASVDVATSSMPRTPQHTGSSGADPSVEAAAELAAGQADLNQLHMAAHFAAARQQQLQQVPAIAVAAASAMVQQTLASLDMWHRMGAGASTPSTVVPCPRQQQQQLRRVLSPARQFHSHRPVRQHASEAQPAARVPSAVSQKRRAEDM